MLVRGYEIYVDEMRKLSVDEGRRAECWREEVRRVECWGKEMRRVGQGR